MNQFSAPTQTVTAPPAPVPMPPGAGPRPGREWLRFVLVVCATLVLIGIVAMTVPGSTIAARKRAYPLPRVSFTYGTIGQAVRENQPTQFHAVAAQGTSLTYTWDFGDGTQATGQNVTHAFSSYGSTTVTLSAIDPIKQSATSTRQIQVMPPLPQASFLATQDPNDPFTIDFDASASTGEQLQYLWNFGDGTTDTYGPQDYHQYSRLGTYTVTLTVTDVANQQSSSSTTVTVSIQKPHATFSYTVTPSFYEWEVSVDASSSTGYQLQYYWDFGDGSTDNSYGPTDFHYYNNPGTYTITLKVVDGAGQTDTYSTQVNVTG